METNNFTKVQKVGMWIVLLSMLAMAIIVLDFGIGAATFNSGFVTKSYNTATIEKIGSVEYGFVYCDVSDSIDTVKLSVSTIEKVQVGDEVEILNIYNKDGELVTRMSPRKVFSFTECLVFREG